MFIESQSVAIKCRSRCGVVRGCPVLSSHLSRGAAPQVGQRTPCIRLRGTFLFTMCNDVSSDGRKMVNTARFSRFLMSAGRPHLCATLGLEVIGADACNEQCVCAMRYPRAS